MLGPAHDENVVGHCPDNCKIETGWCQRVRLKRDVRTDEATEGVLGRANNGACRHHSRAANGTGRSETLEQGIDKGRHRGTVGKDGQTAEKAKNDADRQQPELLPNPHEAPKLL
jgi:hypothetical protein